MTLSPYDAMNKKLVFFYGTDYKELSKKEKAKILYYLGLAIYVVEEGGDLDRFWDRVCFDPPGRFESGFDFEGVKGADLERMVRYQHKIIAAQILGE